MHRQCDWKRHQSHQQQQQQERNPFVKRVSEIPIVKSTSDSLASEYNKVKKFNGLVGGVLEKAEDAVQFADHIFVQPLAKAVHWPVNAISKSADRQLEYFQKLFPPITYTPQRMKKAYHEQSLKDIFIFLINIPMLMIAIAYGWALEIITLIGSTIKALFSSTLDAISGAFDLLVKKPFSWVVEKLISIARSVLIMIFLVITLVEMMIGKVLDIIDWIVDKTIAPPHNDAAGGHQRQSNDLLPQPPPQQQATILQKMGYIIDKVITGVLYYTFFVVGVIKAFLSDPITGIKALFQTAVAILVALPDLIVEKVSKLFNWIGTTLSSLILATAKIATNVTAEVADRVVSVVAPYLPDSTQKPTAAFLSYIHHLQEVVDRAASAEDIWKAVIEETKQNLRLAKQIIQTILNNNDDEASVDQRKKRW